MHIDFQNHHKYFLKVGRLSFPEHTCYLTVFDVVFEVDIETVKPRIKILDCIHTFDLSQKCLYNGVIKIQFKYISEEDTKKV